jgi:alanine dehydrogenase
MLIGVPKEIKVLENRVAITPAGVVSLVGGGHQVLVEKNAGVGSGFADELYVQAGATIVETAQEAWNVEMVLKVKEPMKSEYGYFREGLVLFTYLHLAADLELTNALVESKVTAIAYETVQLPDRSLPLLTPMSEVAGRMATQIGAQYLEKINGGKGILLGGVSGVERGNVVIIGGGQAGVNAARIAVGMGANVTILDISSERLRDLDNQFGASVQTLISNPFNIAKAVAAADLVVGAVLIPGAKAPKLVTEEMVKAMAPGSVLVDVAIDQGGIFESSDRVTTHEDPIYVKHGVVHYAVGNMPGAVPRTSTIALTNTTIPYALQLANQGVALAIERNAALKLGLNVYDGKIVYEQVALAHNLPYETFQTTTLV